MKRKHLLMVLFALLAFAAQADADLMIMPDIGLLNETRWEGSATSQAEINVAIGLIMTAYGTGNTELYKKDYAPLDESGVLKDSYNTAFSGEPNDAVITYQGGDYVGPEAFLLVKDGTKGNPAWYLFDLTKLGYDGTEVLAIRYFWAGTDVNGKTLKAPFHT